MLVVQIDLLIPFMVKKIAIFRLERKMLHISLNIKSFILGCVLMHICLMHAVISLCSCCYSCCYIIM